MKWAINTFMWIYHKIRYDYIWLAKMMLMLA